MIDVLGKSSRYWHTVKHLRREQVLGRLQVRWRGARAERLDYSAAPAPRLLVGNWVEPAERVPSLLAPNRFVFLNDVRDVQTPADWDRAEWPLLWRYNLHYFDDLNAQSAVRRTAWHELLVRRWVVENTDPGSTALAPYPTSLRIVNWVKWLLRRQGAGLAHDPAWVSSLVAQARLLCGRLETHLLGNHLFANAKALVFAGRFFEGDEAQQWFERGARILLSELDEQILRDGGQFERSPMYHALALEDCLDLLNLLRSYPSPSGGLLVELQAKLMGKVPLMRRWLALMTHPDGEVSFFNDSAMAIAPSPGQLEAYSRRLLLPTLGELGGLGSFSAPGVSDSAGSGVVVLPESGYVRCQRDGLVALLDCAPIGPDYLPGHAHADTLSFELSVFGRRCLVNTGTSQYGLGERRQYERSTKAHNTVTVDDADSSEVWAGFRVARRAYPLALEINDFGPQWTVSCAHDGYRRLPGRVLHRRQWRFEAGNRMTISDSLKGHYSQARARLMLAPGWNIDGSASEGAASSVNARPRDMACVVSLSVSGSTPLRFEPSRWAPQFGVLRDTTTLVYDVPAAGAQISVQATPTTQGEA